MLLSIKAVERAGKIGVRGSRDESSCGPIGVM